VGSIFTVHLPAERIEAAEAAEQQAA